MQTVAIVGVGLIGGSFGLALKKAGFGGEILGVSSDAAIAEGVRRGAIDRGLPLADAAILEIDGHPVIFSAGWFGDANHDGFVSGDDLGNIIGSGFYNDTVGGHTWDVFSGSNGSNQVFSFVRQGNTSAASVDILAVLRWIQSRGWMGNVVLNEVQFGFEITSSNGGLKLSRPINFGLATSLMSRLITAGA